ncbi:MAG: sulfatase-like hydrolase/transferase [Lachnospiraceae bacterium]|nr:sulfatase-like hydrolase/transferase [Lachnospiraceae bacterium]
MGSMLQIFFLFVGTYIYMEMVYHFGCFGLTGFQPVIAVPIWVAWAGLASFFTGFLRKKANKTVLWVLLALVYLTFASQLVYMKIFRQPMLVSAVVNTGKDALTNYWREALTGILHASVYLLLLALPLPLTGFLLNNRNIVLKSHSSRERLQNVGLFVGGILVYIVVLVGGYFGNTLYYEDYGGFYDPQGVITKYGVVPSVLRDCMGNIFPEKSDGMDTYTDIPVYAPLDVSGGDVSGSDAGFEEEVVEEPLDTSPNVLPIDFESLIAGTDSKDIIKIAEYAQSMTPTNRNEYTGMFEGYNLIYLTAEGFSPYAVDQELTPTLYKLIHSGFVFDEFYVPLWSTSTSDGEYTNCTGLIPDQMHSMKRSGENANAMPFSLPAFFSLEGVNSYAFHNNTLSYYDRNLSHPNLGYNFMASKLGDLKESEWGGQVFEMENAGYWPASDLNMMEATMPMYINEDRFHVYYMTVSGHMNYNFSGNRMSSLHKAEVIDLPYSEEGRAYIACNIELDRALAYMIEELDKAGKLETTVICLSADHYPYAMKIENLEELAGRPLDGTLDIYRNNLILWNSEMETVEVTKPASSVDILPTLLNLFGFEYDSRMYAGRDILSDSPGLVIFKDRSFITESVSYNNKSKEIIWREGYEENEEYYDAVKSQVKGLYNYSANILNNDFYRYVLENLPEEYHPKIDPEWTAPKPPTPKPDPAYLPEETGGESESESDEE